MDDLNKELFLDILTKEEKEALLTKKMEEIRKKNDALRKRHEEIEADKRVAAKSTPNKNVSFGSQEHSHSGSTSPRKESKPLPGEDKRGPRPGKPAGRGRTQGGGRGKQPSTFRVIRWEAKTGEVDITGQDGRESSSSTPSQSFVDDYDDADDDDSDDEWEPGTRRIPVKEGRLPPAEGWDSDEEDSHGPDTKGRPLSWGEGHRNGENWDSDHRQGPPQSDHRPPHRGGYGSRGGGDEHHPSHRGGYGSHRGGDRYHPPHRGEDMHHPPHRGEDMHHPPHRGEDMHHPPHRGDDASPQNTRGATNSRPQRISGKPGPDNGPPPDPSYNFLSDRRREGHNTDFTPDSPEKQKWKMDTRRHPKNYGGPDFNNVKAQIRTSKERQTQERPKSGPPRTKMELAMVMTGRERRQYMDWKAERDRVDQERLDRQKANNGEWRRAWDAEKTQQDFEQPPSPQRTEPAKRPAGRIGSGRFDRGEREERHRGDTPRVKAGVKPEQEVTTKPVGRGRARGRGRGRGDRSPRQRTTSSGDESRKVERRNDLLVVKIDNSGKDVDKSVEVEYLEDDVRSNSAISVKSSSAASAKSENSSPDSHSKHPRAIHHDDHQFDDHDDGYEGVRHRRQMLSQSVGDENEHDESWEDCPEDCEFYAEDDYIHVDADDYREPLRLECKLNPDAPEFTPTSPDFMKTPPGHVKVIDWVAEVTANLSPTSPPPTMDGVDNEECKKGIFRDKKTDSGKSKKSSSQSGVKEKAKGSKKDLSASYIEDDKAGNAAPEASTEVLDASRDVHRLEDFHEAVQDQKQSSDGGHTVDDAAGVDTKNADEAPQAVPQIKTEHVEDDSGVAHDAAGVEDVDDKTAVDSSDKPAKEDVFEDTNEDHATDSHVETNLPVVVKKNGSKDDSPVNADQIVGEPPQDSSEEPKTSTAPQESNKSKEEDKQEICKEEPEEAATEESREILNDEVLKEEPTNVLKEEPKQVLKEEPKEESKQVLKEEPKQVLKEEPKEESKQVLKEEPKQVLTEEPKQVLKEEPKQVLKEEPKQVPEEEPEQVLKEEPTSSVKEEADSEESAQQMAKSDTAPDTTESDNTEQLEQMEESPKPAESTEKSSTLMTGNKALPVSSEVTTTTTTTTTTTSTSADVEDSHVE